MGRSLIWLQQVGRGRLLMEPHLMMRHPFRSHQAQHPILEVFSLKGVYQIMIRRRCRVRGLYGYTAVSALQELLVAGRLWWKAMRVRRVIPQSFQARNIQVQVSL